MLWVSSRLHDHERVNDDIHEAPSNCIEEDEGHEDLHCFYLEHRGGGTANCLDKAPDDYPRLFAGAARGERISQDAVDELE